jgi:uncharacterized coiled-coil protein SlyX
VAEQVMDGMNKLAGDGGPPHDPGMEARVAVLEEIASAAKQATLELRNEARETNRRMDGLRDRMDGLRDRMDGLRDTGEANFRIMFGALITTALGLAALMAKGFHWF